MGVVYKADDTKLKRIVALKFLPPALTSDREAKERFIHEAQAASALEHPNICNIHEINETDEGQFYIVMACYDGKTLKDRLAEGTLPPEEVVHIAQQIAEGLIEAHDKSIVHRDIKPANIIITEKGRIKIMDFGLAKLAGQTKLTRTGSTLGTAAYMSPEQAQGGPVDHRTDLWSLGVVQYEMLSGQLPFCGDYSAAMIYSIVHERPTPIQNYLPDISTDMLKVLNRCLEKDPSKRYQKSADMLIDLKRTYKEYTHIRDVKNPYPVEKQPVHERDTDSGDTGRELKQIRRGSAKRFALFTLPVVFLLPRL